MVWILLWGIGNRKLWARRTDVKACPAGAPKGRAAANLFGL
jgi:hypothetical protein